MEWGEGYACELLSSLVSDMYKKNGFRLFVVFGRENSPSKRLLRNTGFHLILQQSDGETKMFSITLN
jgi:citrate lyase synthetase